MQRNAYTHLSTIPCRRKTVLGYKLAGLLSTRFEKEAAFDFVSGEEPIVLNIGGQKFQTTAGVLCRDRFSLLACICKVTPPIPKGEDGSFFFERDW